MAFLDTYTILQEEIFLLPIITKCKMINAIFNGVGAAGPPESAWNGIVKWLGAHLKKMFPSI